MITHLKGRKRVLRLQEISCNISSFRRITGRSNCWIKTISSNRSRLRWTNILPHQYVEGSKAYLLLFLYRLTRAVHIQALQNQTTNEFIRALKLLIAKRGRPRRIYSDNAQTLVSAAK